MDPKIIRAIIIFVCLLVLVLQIVALADPKGYISNKRDPVSPPYWHAASRRPADVAYVTAQKCGMFQCDDWGSLRTHHLVTTDENIYRPKQNKQFTPSAGQDYIKAACAFGVIAAVLMGISLILHILLLFSKILGKFTANEVVTRYVVKPYWIVHVLTAICCLISWALLLKYFMWIEPDYTLQHGFFFLVVNMFFELGLAFACFRANDAPKMDPKIIKAIIIFVCLLVLVLQIVALADPTGYISYKTTVLNDIPHSYYISRNVRVQKKCGMFQCDDWGNLRTQFRGVPTEGQTYIKAACAFGVIAAVLMGISLILHILLLPPKILGKLMMNKVMARYVVKPYWIVHVFTAICCLISWALLLAYFDTWIDSTYTLQHGFFFLIINMCFELALAFACFKHMHSDGSKIIVNDSVPPQYPPPGFSDHPHEPKNPNPIEGEV